MLHPALEFSHVDACVLPLVLAKSVRFSFLILSSVDVSICKHIGALPVFKTKLPFAFVAVSILPLVHAVPVCLALGPLSYVGVSKNALPNTLSLLESVPPFSLVDFPVEPGVDAFAVGLVVLEFALVLVSI